MERRFNLATSLLLVGTLVIGVLISLASGINYGVSAALIFFCAVFSLIVYKYKLGF